MNITELTVKQLAKALEQKELSARDAAEAYFSAIGQKDGDVGAYLTVTRELALHQATAVDEKRARGEKLRHWRAFPAALRIISAPGEPPPPAPRRCWSTLYPL